MTLGISTYTYGWAFERNFGQTFDRAFDREAAAASPPLDELDLVRIAAAWQIALIQVGDNLPLHTFSGERLETFKSALRERGIVIEAGAKGLTGEHLRKYILLCGNMGARILRFVIDDNDYRPSVGTVITIIRAHLDLLAQHRVTLALENHDRLKTGELASIIETLGSPRVGICLDTANSIGAGEGIETVLDNLIPYTVNLHIKDFGISRLPHRQGFIIDGRVAGQGMLDIPSLLHRVAVNGRCDTCVLEQWVPPEENSNDTIVKESGWAKKSIDYIKQHLP